MHAEPRLTSLFDLVHEELVVLGESKLSRLLLSVDSVDRELVGICDFLKNAKGSRLNGSGFAAVAARMPDEPATARGMITCRSDASIRRYI